MLGTTSHQIGKLSHDTGTLPLVSSRHEVTKRTVLHSVASSFTLNRNEMIQVSTYEKRQVVGIAAFRAFSMVCARVLERSDSGHSPWNAIKRSL